MLRFKITRQQMQHINVFGCFDNFFRLLQIYIIYIIYILYKYITHVIHYISGHKWSTTHRVLKSHRSKMSVIYVIMKTMCPPSYHHNGFVATHAHHVPKCMSCQKAIVVITGRAHCFHDNIYSTLYILYILFFSDYPFLFWIF